MSEEEKVKVDVLIGTNPHIGLDGTPVYQKLEIVVKQADLYFLLTGNEVVQKGKEGIFVSMAHNLRNFQDHQIMFTTHTNVMETLALQERRKQEPKLIQPGSPEYFMAQRQMKLNNRGRRK